VQKQQKQQADNATPGGKKKKVTAAQLRVQKGMHNQFAGRLIHRKTPANSFL